MSIFAVSGSGEPDASSPARPRRLPRPGADALAVALLLAFCLGFYRQLTLDGRVLVSFDAVAYFYPHLAYLGARLREGELPLWNPYLFTGVPFLANSQTGVLYPPNWLAMALPSARAYAWSAALHAALAAVGAYAFGRAALGVGRPGALATATAFAFGGFFSAQVGHLNQLQAASWLPLLLLVADRLLRRPSAALAAVGAAILGLQLLAGHSQVVYLSLWATLLYVGAGSLASLRELRRDGASGLEMGGWLLSRLWLFLILAVLGAGLAAAQLLPTYELTGQSIRARGLDYHDAASFSLPPWKLLLSLLPSFGGSPIFSEWTGYVGVAGLLLAGLAIATRPDRRVAAMLLLVVVALFMAFGQFNPAYPRLYSHLPGLDLFRVPARWLLLYSFGVAGLAGLGLDRLAGGGKGTAPAVASDLGGIGTAGVSRPGPSLPDQGSPPGRVPLRQPGSSGRAAPIGSIRSRRAIFGIVALGLPAALLALAVYQARLSGHALELPDRTTALGWAVAASLVGGLIAARRASGRARRAGRGLLIAGLALLLLAAELLAASGPLDLNRTNLLAAVDGPSPEVELLRQRPGLYRVLGVSDNSFELGEAASLRARLAGTLTPEGIYDYLVTSKYRKTLTPNVSLSYRIASLDGYDGGVLPLLRYVQLKSLFPEEGKNLADGRLGIQLRTAPDPRLLGWLNVEYLVMDRTRDLWIDGVYYDTAMERVVGPGQPLALTDLPAFDTAALGIVTHLEGAAAPAGAAAALVKVTTDDGRLFTLPIRAGAETEEGQGSPGVEPTLRPVAPGLRDPSVQEYVARLPLPATARPARVEVEYAGQRGRLVVRSLTQVGPEAGSHRVVDLSPDLRLVYLGDTKVYENRAALPRAFAVGRTRLARGDEAALAALRDPSFDPRREAVVGEVDWARPGGGAQGSSALADAARVDVVEHHPERVVVEAELPTTGLLVLTDSAYPGWRATVNGEERAIQRVNHAFRGVKLEAGRHRVVFAYEPASFRVGLAVSGVALLSIVGLIVAPRRARPQNIGQVDTPIRPRRRSAGLSRQAGEATILRSPALRASAGVSASRHCLADVLDLSPLGPTDPTA